MKINPSHICQFAGNGPVMTTLRNCPNGDHFDAKQQIQCNDPSHAKLAAHHNVHPDRGDVIGASEARTALTHFVNRHFDNPGDKSRASIPASQYDDDIILADYITQRESVAAALASALGQLETLDAQWREESRAYLRSIGLAESTTHVQRKCADSLAPIIAELERATGAKE
jgi:hypothetical protein